MGASESAYFSSTPRATPLPRVREEFDSPVTLLSSLQYEKTETQKEYVICSRSLSSDAAQLGFELGYCHQSQYYSFYSTYLFTYSTNTMKHVGVTYERGAACERGLLHWRMGSPDTGLGPGSSWLGSKTLHGS